MQQRTTTAAASSLSREIRADVGSKERGLQLLSNHRQARVCQPAPVILIPIAVLIFLRIINCRVI